MRAKLKDGEGNGRASLFNLQNSCLSMLMYIYKLDTGILFCLH